MYNQCTFIGPVLDKRIQQTTSGKPILFFSIKCWDKEDRATFVSCTAYSGIAERIYKDFPEGRIIFVTAKAHVYKDKDGTKQTNFVIESFEYCSPRPDVA